MTTQQRKQVARTVSNIRGRGTTQRVAFEWLTDHLLGTPGSVPTGAKMHAARRVRHVLFLHRSHRENRATDMWTAETLEKRAPKTRGGQRKDRMTRVEYRHAAFDPANPYSVRFLYTPSRCGAFYDA